MEGLVTGLKAIGISVSEIRVSNLKVAYVTRLAESYSRLRLVAEVYRKSRT